MLVNYETIKAAFDGFKAIYLDALAKVPEDWRTLAMEITAKGPTLTLDWMGDIPEMREWLGERQLKQLAAYKYTLTAKTWESTVEVLREHFEDDNLGIYRPKVEALPLAAQRNKRKLLFELIKNGFASTCYDGQYFFDTDHSEGESGSQSNKGTAALSEPALEDAIAAMMGFKSDRGVVLEIIPDTLVVHPKKLFTARKLIETTTIVIAGSTDTVKPNKMVLGDYINSVIANPYLTDENDWFLLATKYGVKPLVLYMVRREEFAQQIDPNSAYAPFMQNKFLFGIDGRWQAGYGLWQLAYGSEVAG